MKNPAPYLRKKIFALLNGNLTYNATSVPVYEGEGKVTQYQVIIGGYSDVGEPNKFSIIKRAVQEVEIVTIKNDPAAKECDELAEMVMNILSPDVGSDTLSGTDFQVMFISAPSLTPIREEDMSGQRVFRRLLRYNILVEQL